MVEDLLTEGQKLSQENYMKFLKFQLFLGVVCISSAYFGDKGRTVIELIKRYFIPILRAYFSQFHYTFIKRVNYIGMNVGIIGGVAINILTK
jgi:hypothetical protein